MLEGEREVEELAAPLKPVVRLANAHDLETMAKNDARKPEAIRLCKEKIAARGLSMKLIGCEFAFDGSKVIFYFSAEGRVDFRELVKDLASVFRMRIELRQVGVRDETRILGGIAPAAGRCAARAACPTSRRWASAWRKIRGFR